MRRKTDTDPDLACSEDVFRVRRPANNRCLSGVVCATTSFGGTQRDGCQCSCSGRGKQGGKGSLGVMAKRPSTMNVRHERCLHQGLHPDCTPYDKTIRVCDCGENKMCSMPEGDKTR